MKISAFTISEVLVSMAIVLVLAAILGSVAPMIVFSSNKTRAVSDMKQIYIAFELYRSDWGGGYESIPLASETTLQSWAKTFDTPAELWRGCRPPSESGITNSVRYFFMWNGAPYNTWFSRYGSKLPVVFDMSCSVDNKHEANIYESRIGTAVQLDGSLTVAENKGNPLEAEFWVR